MSASGNARTSLLLGALLASASPASLPAQTPADAAAPAGLKAPALQDGQHDFDFEFGSWRAHLRRRLHPLSANLGEFKVANATTHIEGLTLRLYDPGTRQWSIFWANARDGELGTPPNWVTTFTR
jgi:hypothetical protein